MDRATASIVIVSGIKIVGDKGIRTEIVDIVILPRKSKNGIILVKEISQAVEDGLALIDLDGTENV
jgi:hypothetical protein